MKNNAISEELSDRDLAALHVRFVVPMAVAAILRGEEPMDDVSEFMINDILDNLEPDTALICIALCAQRVAALTAHVAIGRAMGSEADRIVNEYGSVWLAHEGGRISMDDAALRAHLSHIPEDVESLGDLLMATGAELMEEADAVPAILCDILGAQAHVHREKAEIELERHGLTDRELPELPAGAGGSNVIRFPLRR